MSLTMWNYLSSFFRFFDFSHNQNYLNIIQYKLYFFFPAIAVDFHFLVLAFVFVF